MTFAILRSNCPICQETHHDNYCRTNNDIYLCRGCHGDRAHGFDFVKMTDNLIWGIYVQNNRNKQKREFKARSATVDNKVPDFNAYKAFEASKTLNAIHKNKLIKRGVTDFTPYFSHTIKSDYPFASISGMYIKCLGYQDVTLGYQIAPDSKQLPKYLWASKDGSARIKGEMPVQLAKGENKDIVILCEGILKPCVARDRQQYTFIGAAGGNWVSSKKLIHKMLNAIAPKQIYIAPDANSLNNDSIWLNIQKASQEFNANILDWGQLEDKQAPDIDELPNFVLQL